MAAGGSTFHSWSIDLDIVGRPVATRMFQPDRSVPSTMVIHLDAIRGPGCIPQSA
jgi:hypothetical protein